MASVSSSSYDGRYFKFTVTQSGTSTTLNWKFEVLGGTDLYYTASPITCKIGTKTVYSTSNVTDYSTEAFPAAKGSKSGTYDVGSYSSYTISLSGRPWYHDAGDAKTATLTLTKPTYTISYNANGGTGAPSSQIKTYGTNLTLSSTEPTKTGYTFEGWALSQADADNGTWYYQAGGTCGKNENLTLYAVWSENKLTLSYYSNYATSAFDEALNTVGADKNVKVWEYEFYYDNDYSTYGLANYSNSSGSVYMTRTGYTGTGKWGTSTSGGTLIDENTGYSTGQALAQALGKDLSSGNASVNVYAQWSENALTVNYYSNYATYGSYKGEVLNVSASTNVLAHSQQFYYDNAANTGLADIQNADYLYLHRMGYTPTGDWGTSTDGGTIINEKTSFATGQALAEEFNKDLSNSNASIDIYPQWQINTYALNYNANGGSGSMTSQTVEWKEVFQLLNNDFLREGYKLIGWNLYRNNDNKWYALGQGWYTEDEILANGYEKKVYENQAELTFDASWVRDNEEAREYTLYAVWKISGVVYIDNGTTFEPYLAYIDNGTDWDLYVAYIDDGVDWNIIS